MQPRARNTIGAVTALLWIAVGAYMAVAAVDAWRMVGVVIMALGVLRGVLLFSTWNQGKRPPEDE